VEPELDRRRSLDVFATERVIQVLLTTTKAEKRVGLVFV
jgi:hypothetical protein